MSAAAAYQLPAGDGDGPYGDGQVALVRREVVVRVAGVVLEPFATQPDGLCKEVELLETVIGEVVARHMAPVEPAAWPGAVAANVIYQDHVGDIVA